MSRISVNKLGEYLESNPTRRRKIVFDQKNPSPFIVARYSRAREIAIDYFCNNFDEEILIRGIEELENIVTTTDFQENDVSNSLEFLTKLLEFEGLNFMRLEEILFSKYNGSNPKLAISEVDVSVSPDLILSGEMKGKTIIGALKFHFSKTSPLNAESAKNVATLIHQFVENFLLNDEEHGNIKYCISLDVFAGVVETAPKSFMRRRNNISYACTEIALWWDKL